MFFYIWTQIMFADIFRKNHSILTDRMDYKSYTIMILN